LGEGLRCVSGGSLMMTTAVYGQGGAKSRGDNEGFEISDFRLDL
jgi:hypothetical protein